MKKQVLNGKGMVLLMILLVTAIILGAADSNDMTIFLITKVISLGLISICLILTKYIPQRYL